MAGAAPVPSGRGRRKALDAAINLVPFIDLLSCCISFLLITAVWTQLAALRVAPGGADGDGGRPDSAPRLVVSVDGDGYLVALAGAEARRIPRRADGYDYPALSAALTEARARRPELDRISLRAADGVLYQDLVRAMDVAIAAGLPGIDVNGVDADRTSG
jgi:biopolymer transport protein ExbD